MKELVSSYSDKVLPRMWRYQEFSQRMTDTMHDAGDPTLHGVFRQATAKARVDELFAVPAAARHHSEFLHGTA